MRREGENTHGESIKNNRHYFFVFYSRRIYCGKLLESRAVVPAGYTQSVKTGGTVESKYIACGAYEVSSYEENVLHVFSKYTVYYPDELESAPKTTNKKYPVIVVCNVS